MSKNFAQNAENRSVFLIPTDTNSERIKKGGRADTSPFRDARLIDIDRIEPDPKQPRKTFVQETLESLAESIKELDGIIDPLTVEYDDQGDIFRIISGERRYRAAKMVGFEKLPCVVKEINDRKRFLIQLIANLQREDIPPLEEAAGIKYLVENHGYTQTKIARLLNKSKSYVSQILGLERLAEPAREIVQTSELSKEIQIHASKEKDPEKQLELLKKASEENKTVRQIRKEQKESETDKTEEPNERSDWDGAKQLTFSETSTFSEWTWEPRDRRFVLTIRFNQEQSENKKTDLIQKSLEEALKHTKGLNENLINMKEAKS